MVYYLFYLLKLTKVAIIFKEFEASTKIDLKGIDKLLCLDNFLDMQMSYFCWQSEKCKYLQSVYNIRVLNDNDNENEFIYLDI